MLLRRQRTSTRPGVASLRRPAGLTALLIVALGLPLAAETVELQRARTLVGELGSPLPSVARRVRDALLSAGDEALPSLQLALAEGNHRARAEAVRVLAVLERDRIDAGIEVRYTDDLVGALDDEAEIVRRAAVRALIYLGATSLEHVRARFDRPGAPPRAYLEEIEDTILRRDVELELASVISEDGGYGTYPGAFAGVAALGPGATEVALRIFEDPSYEPVSARVRDDFIVGYKVRFLAGSALYEISGDEIAPGLRRLYDEVSGAQFDPDRLIDLEPTVATILSLRGDHSRFHAEISEVLELIELARSQGALRLSSYWADLADMHLKSHRNRSSVRWYRAAAQRGARTLSSPVHQYNVACAYARMGERDLAVEALELAVDYGYSELSWLRRDGDLDPIRDHPRFAAIEDRVERGEFGGSRR